MALQRTGSCCFLSSNVFGRHKSLLTIVNGNDSIALRTFITKDFMTGVPAIPGRDIPVEVVDSIVQTILSEVPGIARVCYDLTSKPPATTEWE